MFTSGPDDVMGTMIRHGSPKPFLAIDSLTMKVCQSASLSALIAAVCCTPLLLPNQLTTIYTAIALASITAFAYKEHSTAIGRTTKAQTKAVFTHGFHNLNFLSDNNNRCIEFIKPRNHAFGVDDVEMFIPAGVQINTFSDDRRHSEKMPGRFAQTIVSARNSRISVYPVPGIAKRCCFI